MSTSHRDIATLAATLAEQVVAAVGTSSPYRSGDLTRALAKAIGEHITRCSTEQVAINETQARLAPDA